MLQREFFVWNSQETPYFTNFICSTGRNSARYDNTWLNNFQVARNTRTGSFNCHFIEKLIKRIENLSHTNKTGSSKRSGNFWMSWLMNAMLQSLYRFKKKNFFVTRCLKKTALINLDGANIWKYLISIPTLWQFTDKQLKCKLNE